MRFNHLKRREFIRILAGAASTWPLSARAQTPPKPARLGYIWIGSKGSERSTLDGIRQGLHELGYAEGRDFILEDRYADFEPERLPAIVAELLRLKVDLFLSPGNPVTRAAMQATSTIPIIATTPDLLESGFVASLARPGGNVTGISLTAGATLSEKWLELLKETFPNVTKVAVLSNLTSASSAYLDRMRTVASVLGVQPQYFAAQNPAELDRALAEITVMMPDGLVVESDATLVSNRTKIIAFAALMAYRCKDLEILSANQFSYIMRQMNIFKIKKHEPLDDKFQVRKPGILADSIKLLLDNGVQSKAQIEDALALNLTDIESLCGLPRGYLDTRIVPFRPRIN